MDSERASAMPQAFKVMQQSWQQARQRSWLGFGYPVIAFESCIYA
jgi:hypothetical protein